MINGWFCEENFPGLLAFAVPKNATPPNFVEKTFAEKTFTNSRKTTKFAKVESFPLYSIVAINLLEP